MTKPHIFSQVRELDHLTVGPKDVAHHSSQVLILCQLVHHICQAAGRIAEEGREASGQARVHQELCKRSREELQQNHEPYSICNFLTGALKINVKFCVLLRVSIKLFLQKWISNQILKTSLCN